MRHRKSLDAWWEGERDAATSRETQAVIAALTESIVEEARGRGFAVGSVDEPDRPEVDLNELEYAVWLAVELARADSSEGGTRPADKQTLNEALLEEFGTAEAVEAARDLYRSVLERLRAAGPRAVIKPPAALAIRRLASIERLASERRPERMSKWAIIQHSIRRAHELGFSPVDIWARRQGRRSPRHAAEKAARERIVVELRDLGASQAHIGDIFGQRKQQSVAALERDGRAQLAKEARPNG